MPPRQKPHVLYGTFRPDGALNQSLSKTVALRRGILEKQGKLTDIYFQVRSPSRGAAQQGHYRRL